MKPRSSLPIPHTILVTCLSLSLSYMHACFLAIYISLSPFAAFNTYRSLPVINIYRHITSMNMLSSLCAHEQQQKFGYLSKKSLREIDIPPRKLIGRRSAASPEAVDSPKVEDAVFSKFLPYNNANDDDSDDPYSSDNFRIYEFKVRKCNRSRSHDWTDCPFAHPGEKARRRDPRRFQYSGTVCSEFRKGQCSKADSCEFSHGVFECWLHPSRYRTEACKDGKSCKRKVCFFAHTTRQLRLVPETNPDPVPQPANSPPSDHHKSYYNNKNLSGYCACCGGRSQVNNASPTSTLMGLHGHVSPPGSPPISPSVSSPYGVSYKHALTDVMASFEPMCSIGEVPDQSRGSSRVTSSLPWLDVNFGSASSLVDEQPQFVLSPSTPTTVCSGFGGVGNNSNYSNSRFLASPRYGDISGRRFDLMEDNNVGAMTRFAVNNNEGSGGPDLEWVNDLLT